MPDERDLPEVQRQRREHEDDVIGPTPEDMEHERQLDERTRPAFRQAPPPPSNPSGQG